MKVVKYDRSLEWVGALHCHECDKKTAAWRASGMSNCFPHFYCDRCSNVIHRSSDQQLVWDSATKELLDQITSGLPACPCGGQFAADTNPKCGHCNAPIPHQGNAITRLHDPQMIVAHGACVFGVQAEPYKVEILD